ncbi:MAG: trk/ktr system potassium uptake protein [Thermoplasmata archaeon]|nr:trk/ktr system potassium uptake protein [Thermoplasmata archaeon]
MIRISRILSAMAAAVRVTALVLLVPVVVAFLYEPHDTLVAGVLVPGGALPFVVSAVLSAAVWLPLRIVTRRAAQEELLEREAYLAVALGWVACTALAGLPFLTAGKLGPLESFFEAMSGLTGTGLSALHDIDGTSLSLLFWRALLQWVGGLAFIVLTAALLSRLTHGGLQFFRSEGGGHAGTRIRPRLAETARELGKAYVGLTALFAVLLFFVLRFKLHMEDGRATLEAVVETFAAYGNGAFTLHANAAFHDDGAVQAVLSLMMLAGATNVTLAFLLVRRGQVRNLVTNTEWRFFFGLVATTVVGVALLLVRAGLASTGSLGQATDLLPGLASHSLREAAFTVTSLATGSGLFSTDYAVWPGAAQLLLLFAILVGGTAGSAAGGIKAFRALTLLKVVGREVRRLLHPRAVIPVRVGQRVVPEQTVSAVVAFFFTYLLAWLLGAFLLLVAESMGVLDATSVSLAALSNVGAGFGSVGPTIGTAHLTSLSKVVLSFLMWFGRMEVFAALLVFTPSSWRN